MEYVGTLVCSKCKKRCAETDLTWVRLKGVMRLVCDLCKEGKTPP